MDYIEETTRHRKKRRSSVSKASVKTDHKHKYVACLLRSAPYGREHLAMGKRCSVCGKMSVSKYFVLEKGFVLGPEQLRKKYPGLPVYEAGDHADA